MKKQEKTIMVIVLRDGVQKLNCRADIRAGIPWVWSPAAGRDCAIINNDRLVSLAIPKTEIAERMKTGKLTDQDMLCAMRMGDNGNGVEVLTLDEYNSRTAGDRAAKAEIEKYTKTIHLSSRGWGDYSPVEWVGDVRRPDTEIIAECRTRLDNSYDIDARPTDAEIAEKIASARGEIKDAAIAETVDQLRLTDLQKLAKETGKPQIMNRWTTHKCMNGNDDECSFDSAIKTIDSRGNQKVTYTCCY